MPQTIRVDTSWLAGTLPPGAISPQRPWSGRVAASGFETIRPGRGRGRLARAAPDCDPKVGDVDWGPISSAPSQPFAARAWSAMVDDQILDGRTHSMGWIRRGELR